MKQNKNSFKSPAKKGTLSRLVKFIFKNYKAKLLLVLGCIIVSSLTSVVMTVCMQKLIDNAITPGITLGLNAVWGTILKYILIIASVYLFGTICSYFYTRTMAIVTQDSLYKLRKEMFNKMQKLPIVYFDTNSHGAIMSTYTNDTDAIRQLISSCIPTLMQCCISIISLLIMMLYYSIWLTLVVFAVISIMLIVAKYIGGNSSKYMVEQQRQIASEEGFIQEMINGQKVIKVFCHEQETKKDFDQINDNLFKSSESAHKYANIMMPVLANLGNIMYVVVAIIGGLLVYFNVMNFSLSGIGYITIGIIVSFLTISRQVSQSVTQVTSQVSMIAMGTAGASRIFELIDQQEEHDNGYVKLVNALKDENGNLQETDKNTGIWAWRHPHKDGSVTYTELKGDIRLENVNFGYKKGTEILHDISLYAKPGQKIAFVGATGAGKTTITNLINRFYDINKGKIRYDGININKICKSDLRKSFGMVLQDTNLFTGTVMDNIRYGRLDATDEECIEAAKLANADNFITRLPEGYNTMLYNNGANLSQGQRQLLSIARAAVLNPPALILDEATSSIDTHTEALVQDGMDKLMHGRTIFVIAHRLSTVRNSNAIIVLDHGKIIERGTHEQLLDLKGTYYQLYTGAFELE